MVTKNVDDTEAELAAAADIQRRRDEQISKQAAIIEKCATRIAELEAKLTAVEAALDKRKNAEPLLVAGRDARIAELQKDLAMANARATAFFEEGIKKAKVIVDREAAIKAFEKENAKLRMEQKEIGASVRLLLNDITALMAEVEAALPYLYQNLTKSTPTPKRRH